MRTPRLFIDQELITGNIISLDKNASSYLIKVLRLQSGSEINLFNGKPVNNEYGYYRASLKDTGKKTDVEIQDFIPDNNSSPIHITLLQGISKGDHMDITIQKAVELGVTEIIPVICERTVVNLKADRLDKKIKHWNGIVHSACEQSGRNQLLTIHTPVKFENIQLQENATGFILQPDSSHSLLNSEKSSKVSLLIGPEGGFTDNEINSVLSKGYTAVKFGPRILRTETAAISAISIIQSSWGDLN